MNATFNILTSFLSDDEADRIYDSHPDLGKDPETYCPTCDKAGTYRWRGEIHQCDCLMQLQLAKHYTAAGIGDIYQRLDWHDFERKAEILEQVEKYLVRHKQYIKRGIGLFFSGERGTGKTMFATLVLKELVKLGYRCYSIEFDGMVKLLAAGWKSDEERRYFDRKILLSDVLLLDDVQERNSSLAQSTFDTVLRTRVQHARPTFVTSNLDAEQLESCYGTGVLNLLQEQSIFWEFSGDNFHPKTNRRALQEVHSEEVRPIV